MSKPETKAGPGPISRPVLADTIPTSGLHMVIEPGEAELKAATKLLRILAIDSMRAELKAMRKGVRIRIEGTVRAEIKQACVVTLEPVPQDINEHVELVFAPIEDVRAAMRAAGIPDHVADLADADPDELAAAMPDLEVLLDPEAIPDPIEDGVIDFGAIALEAVALGLDPYPRKPGAVFEPPPEPEGFGSPFGALGKLKRGD